MTKSEFVDQVASRADLQKNDASKAVDAVLDVIQEALQRGPSGRAEPLEARELRLHRTARGPRRVDQGAA